MESDFKPDDRTLKVLDILYRETASKSNILEKVGKESAYILENLESGKIIQNINRNGGEPLYQLRRDARHHVEELAPSRFGSNGSSHYDPPSSVLLYQPASVCSERRTVRVGINPIRNRPSHV